MSFLLTYSWLGVLLIRVKSCWVNPRSCWRHWRGQSLMFDLVMVVTAQRYVLIRFCPVIDSISTLKFCHAVKIHWGPHLKGQLISKANCQEMNSSKKWTNEFVFTTMQHIFFLFLEEIEDSKKAFRNYLTFSITVAQFSRKTDFAINMRMEFHTLL